MKFLFISKYFTYLYVEQSPSRYSGFFDWIFLRYSKRSININKRIFRGKVCVRNFSKASFLLSTKQELMWCRRWRGLAQFLVLENDTRGRELHKRREQIVVRKWKNLFQNMLKCLFLLKWNLFLYFVQKLTHSNLRNNFFLYFQLINQSPFIIHSSRIKKKLVLKLFLLCYWTKKFGGIKSEKNFLFPIFFKLQFL